MIISDRLILKGLDELMMACESIKYAELCEKCPQSDRCLCDESLFDIACHIKEEDVNKLRRFGERAESIAEERNKTEYERREEYLADEWLLRQNDPEDM